MVSNTPDSKGFDVSQVAMIINYDLPEDALAYLSRGGRRGRYGRRGTVINLVASEL